MRRLAFAVIVVVFFAACDDKPKSNATMINVYERAKQVGEEANLDAVRKSLQAYYAANERYPQDLSEIKEMIGAKIDITKYDYNPQTGAVKIKDN